MNEGQRTIRADERLRHIAFIMDGNGRWAKSRGLAREEGHKVGVKTFEKIADHCFDIGLQTVTFYAFSTENWKRPPVEVKAIMLLLSHYLEICRKKLDDKNASLRVIGDVSAFDAGVQKKIRTIERDTAGRPATLQIALNYGARAELLRAFRTLAENGGEITEKDVDAALYTAGSPDPDMIVRTGGEKRLSNFLLWQASYAELYFCDTLWPDFSEAEVDAAVEEFYSRKRRYGGV